MARTTRVKLNNPALLEWARQTAGYDVEDIAAYFRKSVDSIRAWEEGKGAPTYRQLQVFAKKVRRPVSTLFLPEVPEEPPPPEDFRVLPGEARNIFSPKALIAFREFRNNLAELRVILDELGDPVRFALPEWPDLEWPVFSRAAELRHSLGVTFDTQMKWGDEYEALNEWRHVLFDQGVVVQVFDIPVEDLRGFSDLAYNLGGIALSSKDAPMARIFSLFHEVAHLCLRRPGVSGQVAQRGPITRSKNERLERYCDALAAAFLLPHDHRLVVEALDALEKDFTFGCAQRWAEQFKVSKYVIARRIFDLKMVDWDTYWGETNAWRDHDARIAARPREELGGPDAVRVKLSHVGRPYIGKVMQALDSGVLTTYEASKIVGVKPQYLDKAYLMVP